MTTVDCRCFCHFCEKRTTSIYRMVGACLNCGAEPILFLIRAGDKAPTMTFPVECPTCGVRAAYANRLATEDEIPAAEPLPS